MRKRLEKMIDMGNNKIKMYKRKEFGMSQEKGKKDLLARVLQHEELVEYQEGSVVSRTIINKDAGTVTLFAFDAGEGLSEHKAPYDALVYILDGEAEIRISGVAHQLKQGEMIIMPAHAPHALKAIKRFKMMLVMIKSQETSI